MKSEQSGGGVEVEKDHLYPALSAIILPFLKCGAAFTKNALSLSQGQAESRSLPLLHRSLLSSVHSLWFCKTFAMLLFFF